MFDSILNSRSQLYQEAGKGEIVTSTAQPAKSTGMTGASTARHPNPARVRRAQQRQAAEGTDSSWTPRNFQLPKSYLQHQQRQALAKAEAEASKGEKVGEVAKVEVKIEVKLDRTASHSTQQLLEMSYTAPSAETFLTEPSQQEMSSTSPEPEGRQLLVSPPLSTRKPGEGVKGRRRPRMNKMAKGDKVIEYSIPGDKTKYAILDLDSTLDKLDSWPAMSAKPRFLQELESFIDRELYRTACDEVDPTESTLDVFKQAFQSLCGEFSTYKSLLSRIQDVYDAVVIKLQAENREIAPLKNRLATVQQEVERKFEERLQAQLAKEKVDRATIKKLEAEAKVRRNTDEEWLQLIQAGEEALAAKCQEFEDSTNTNVTLTRALQRRDEMTRGTLKELNSQKEKTEEMRLKYVELQQSFNVAMSINEDLYSEKATDWVTKTAFTEVQAALNRELYRNQKADNSKDSQALELYEEADFERQQLRGENEQLSVDLANVTLELARLDRTYTPRFKDIHKLYLLKLTFDFLLIHQNNEFM
jgi:hypothetical protein